MYIHGRCKDQSPILIVNFGVLQDLLQKGIIDSANFCSLHNFFGLYMQYNMLVPGQVEKWINLTNIN
jgi:hypothetical protein